MDYNQGVIDRLKVELYECEKKSMELKELINDYELCQIPEEVFNRNDDEYTMLKWVKERQIS